jgi:hypothetical protein
MMPATENIVHMGRIESLFAIGTCNASKATVGGGHPTPNNEIKA